MTILPGYAISRIYVVFARQNLFDIKLCFVRERHTIPLELCTVLSKHRLINALHIRD